jgi:hypothetical protein
LEQHEHQQQCAKEKYATLPDDKETTRARSHDYQRTTCSLEIISQINQLASSVFLSQKTS